MKNKYFQFKAFTVHQSHSKMKVTTDACILGAYADYACKEKGTIIDVGAGTGVLSLMLAQKNNSCKIIALEIDDDSIIDLQYNIENSIYKEQIRHEHIDAIDWNEQCTEKVAGIISNPPYFNELNPSEDKGIARARHEKNSLGMNQLLSIIKERLSNTGKAYVMYPYSRMHEFINATENADLSILELLNIKDTQGAKPHIFIGCLQQKKEILKTETKELIIKNQKNEYTEAFTHLLSPFYLYL
jgi:tRNA1Val (adenine37-N6)-methyltransferase